MWHRPWGAVWDHFFPMGTPGEMSRCLRFRLPKEAAPVKHPVRCPGCSGGERP